MKAGKNQSKQVVTKAFLTKVLKREFGKVGKRMDGLEGRMDRLEERMDRLEERMDRLEKTVITYIDEKITALEEKMYTKEDHDKFMTYLDEAMAELRDGWEGRKLYERQSLRMDDQIHNHEKRIIVLEEKVIL